MPAITKPNQHFNATTYTGTGATQTITNSGSMQPDFVWIKTRNQSGYGHELFDSVRGATKFLISNSTGAESTEATSLTAFNSNGFSVGAYGFINGSGDSIVGWQWKAGGTAVTNTTGTISAQVSANPTAGFSVVTYTGTGANATVGHGLGVALSMLILKRRNAVNNWPVWHIGYTGGAGYYTYLDLTNGIGTASNMFNATNPASTVFSVGTNDLTNGSGDTYVAYCFAPVAGYSAFGSYTGNGSADGPFVYTGFRPRFVMVKASSSSSNWFLWDTARNTYNATTTPLFPNGSAAEEATLYPIDVLSNGFKLRSTAGLGPNENALTYIYAAFAEAPFKFASAR